LVEFGYGIIIFNADVIFVLNAFALLSLEVRQRRPATSWDFTGSQGDGKIVFGWESTITPQRWYRVRICSRKSSIPALLSSIVDGKVLDEVSLNMF
jgi:hypothetical protein